MEQKSIEQTARYLKEVEKLSNRQIEKKLHIGHRRLKRILGDGVQKMVQKPSILEPYRGLMHEWRQTYPNLKAVQIYERLKPYGYTGSYPTVVEFTKAYRERKPEAYHALEFLPGEEAQVDWFFFRSELLGLVAGFLYLLSYSRYAWGRFYPRTSFEFFLDGHLECIHHLKGLAHRHRYDNLKSVVLKRSPEIEYNPGFLDFSRHYGFSIHLCNPYRGNEKGRVERLVRDCRIFLYGETFHDLKDLNQRFQVWLAARNDRVHRSTGSPPKQLLMKEHLLTLPQNVYPSRRIIPAARISKTALVDFDGNQYSAPTVYAGKTCELLVFCDQIEIWTGGKRIASHKRSFKRKKVIQNPLHAKELLERSPRFKYERIQKLLKGMDPALNAFLSRQPDNASELEAAYQLFCLMRDHSKSLVIAAVSELVRMGTFQVKAVRSFLHLPEPRGIEPIWPQDSKLLALHYEPRRLNDYDPAD